jgi:hypothetical protein
LMKTCDKPNPYPLAYAYRRLLLLLTEY